MRQEYGKYKCRFCGSSHRGGRALALHSLSVHGTMYLDEIEQDLRARLSRQVLEHYLPIVFTCDCKGKDSSCAAALADPATVIQGNLVRSISNWLLS
jgi:hypothetical protein